MSRHHRRLLLRILGVPLLFAVLAGASWGIARFYSPSDAETGQTIVLERGVGLGQIARALEDGGVINNAIIFRTGVRLTGKTRALRAGEYFIPARSSAKSVIGILASGKTVVRRLTVPEGLTVVQVAALLESVEALDGGLGDLPGEGRVLPETYFFSWGDTRAGVLARMQSALGEALAEVWAERDVGLPFDVPEQALILASIVERETARPEERARVAAVFVNRLRLGMRLQSDPTVAYGLTHGRGPLGRSLTRADLRSDTPYNTYVIKGLPPGPITSPGRAALEAVVHPAQTDELYFVADGEGGHAFAKTLAEHQRNVARWRALQDRQRGSGD